MATADVHQHCVPGGFVDRVRAEGARHGFGLSESPGGFQQVDLPNGGAQPVDRRLEEGLRLTDQGVRLGELSGVGIDISIQSIMPRMMSYDAGESQALWLSRAVNDALAEEMQKDPEHVVAMGTVPLQFPKLAARELERIVSDHGIPCVQIATHVGDQNLDDPDLFDFWAAAQELDVLVFVHPNYPTAKERLTRYHLINLIGNPLEDSIAVASIIFGGVLDRFPSLKLCFAHAGGYVPWIRGRWRHGQAVRAEAREGGAHGAFDDYFAMLYFDTIIHDDRALGYLIDTVDADRIVHGTDYPADMSDWHQVSAIRKVDGLSEDDQDKILGGNALRLIGRAP